MEAVNNMKHECMIYSNNPDPNYLVLYFDRDGEEIFREEFHIDDKSRDFEVKYLNICNKIQTICPELWEKLDSNRNFRRRLRTCQWIETWKFPCL